VPGLTCEGLAERSAMGTRFRARRAEDRRAVWVIVLADPLREADLRRIDAMTQSRHPNLAATLSVAGSDCGPYLVLERTLGDTLREWVAREGVPPERTALNMALQIARGLRHAAFHGTLHGALSPRNVRVAPDGHVQVEDAGLADLRPAPDDPVREPGFASPERLRTGVAPDARSDIYSLGAVLHFLLTGKAPFEGDAEAVERAQKERGTPDPRALRGSVSREASAFVTTLLALDAEMRPLTWDQVLVDLERLVSADTDALPDSLRGRVARFVALHPLVACVVAAAPLLAAAVWLHFAASALPPGR
jgi:eukaryotic-like serine/threonine-protein kinase